MICNNSDALRSDVPLLSGRYVDDGQAGRDYADELVKSVVQGNRSAPEFAADLRTMLKRGQYGGFEVGFAFRLHALLLNGAEPVH